MKRPPTDSQREEFQKCQVKKSQNEASFATIKEVPERSDWNMDDNLSGMPWGSFSFIPSIAKRSRQENSQRGGSTIKGGDVTTHITSPKPEDNHTSPPEAEEDSGGYETETDYGEDGSPDSSGHSLACHNLSDIDTQNEAPRKSFIRPILCPLKQRIVERIMTEFWVIFNQEWQSNIKSCDSTPSTSTDSPESQTLSQNSFQPPNRKRRLEENSDFDSDDGGGNSKRSNQMLSPHAKVRKGADFACPYRKHDSRKYNVGSWRSCALTPLAGVSRVKSVSIHNIAPPPHRHKADTARSGAICTDTT